MIEIPTVPGALRTVAKFKKTKQKQDALEIQRTNQDDLNNKIAKFGQNTERSRKTEETWYH